MTKSIVVQFFPDGTVAHTRDKDFDLADTLGAKRSIQRMTDIKFDEEAQKFYVEFLRGHDPDGQSLKGCTIGVDPYTIDDTDWQTFDTYEEAVAREIEVVNRLRLLGYKF